MISAQLLILSESFYQFHFMNKIILPFLLLAGISCIAQFPVQTKMPTQFDKFILKNKIAWAAYISDTVRFTENNLNLILRTRFEKNGIRVSLPVIPRTDASNKISYATKATVLAALPPDVYFDELAANLVDVVEILFIKKNKLRSYVAWVNPKYSVITPGGTRLGYADYFSSCFNYKHDGSPSSPRKNLFLGQTKRRILIDSFPAGQQLKSLFGKNLVESLWPSVTNGKVAVFTIEKNQQLSQPEIDTSFVFEKVAIPTPVYDSTGNLSAKNFLYAQKISPDVFKEVVIVQNWYYDQKKNMLYSLVPEIILYAKSDKYDDQQMGSKPALKIIF